MSLRHRICVNCKNTSFEKLNNKTIKCLNCGLETDIRRKERFRSKKKETSKDKRSSYVPVEVICSCGEVLIKKLDNPWSGNKASLKEAWENHYCKNGLTSNDLLYD